MSNREEMERDLEERELISRHRESVQKRLFEESKPQQQSQQQPEKRLGRPKVFVLLLSLQMVLLSVWGLLFFILGMLTQYNMIPFLPRLIEALRVLFAP